LLFNVNKIEVQLHIYDKNMFINNISTCRLKGGNWFDIIMDDYHNVAQGSIN
jgi:hypothetical protein